MASSREVEESEVDEEEEKKKKKVKYRKRKWWKKCMSMTKMKRGNKKKTASKKSESTPKARRALGCLGSALFLIMGQNWLSVSAAAEGPHKRTEAVTRMQQEVQIKENRWTQATSKR